MGFFSLVPLISPFYISIFGAVSLMLRFTSPWNVINATLFVLAHLYVLIVVDTQIMEHEMNYRHESERQKSSGPNGIIMVRLFSL